MKLKSANFGDFDPWAMEAIYPGPKIPLTKRGSQKGQKPPQITPRFWKKPSPFSRNNERGIVERWRILNTLVLAGQTGRLGLLGSRGGAFYEHYILRELREIRVHIESSCPRPLGVKYNSSQQPNRAKIAFWGLSSFILKVGHLLPAKCCQSKMLGHGTCLKMEIFSSLLT